MTTSETAHIHTAYAHVKNAMFELAWVSEKDAELMRIQSALSHVEDLFYQRISEPEERRARQ